MSLNFEQIEQYLEQLHERIDELEKEFNVFKTDVNSILDANAIDDDEDDEGDVCALV